MGVRNWTDEQKQRQRELIQTWKPWEKSTGAKTTEGKRISSMNALKHGWRSRRLNRISLTKTIVLNPNELLEQ